MATDAASVRDDASESKLKWRIDVEDYVSDDDREDDDDVRSKKNRNYNESSKDKNDSTSQPPANNVKSENSLPESKSVSFSDSTLSNGDISLKSANDTDSSKKKAVDEISETNDKADLRSRNLSSDSSNVNSSSIADESLSRSMAIGSDFDANSRRSSSYSSNYSNSNNSNVNNSNNNQIKEPLDGRWGVTTEKISASVKRVEKSNEVRPVPTPFTSSTPISSTPPSLQPLINSYPTSHSAPSRRPNQSEEDFNTEELNRLTETLKAVRRKPADSSEELEIKTYKISMLQAAIRDARARAKRDDINARSQPVFPADSIGTGGTIFMPRGDNLRRSAPDLSRINSTPPRPSYTPQMESHAPLPLSTPPGNDSTSSPNTPGNHYAESPDNNGVTGRMFTNQMDNSFPPKLRLRPPISPQRPMSNGSPQVPAPEQQYDNDASRRNLYQQRSQTMPPNRHSFSNFDSPSSPRSDRSFPVMYNAADNQSMHSASSSSQMRRSISSPQSRRYNPEQSFSSPNNALAVRTYSHAEMSRQESVTQEVVDVQNFSKLVSEMQIESEQVMKLKQQNKLLHGWYAEAKTDADGKYLQSLEAKLRADVSEEWAAYTCRQMTELESKVEQLKESIIGSHLLENENAVLRKRVLAMTSSKSFKQPNPEPQNGQVQNHNSAPREGGPGVLSRPGRAAEIASDQNTLRQSASRSQTGLEDFNRWVVEMQEEGGNIAVMKKINKLLQGWYSEENSKSQDSINKLNEEHARMKEAQEMTAAGQLLLRDLEQQRAGLNQQYAHRLLLEEENKELHQKILLLTSSKASQIPHDKLQERVLRCVSENLGYNKGRPVAACIVHKAMSHWQVVQVERSSILDKVIAIMQASTTPDAPQEAFCYWLSNAAVLHFLKAHGPSRVDALLAKKHLGAQIERLYVAIRDRTKEKLLSYLTSDIQTNNYWAALTTVLRDLFDDLRLNYVPPFLARALFHQLVSAINVKIFNNIVMHNPWWPCTMVNGETMASGLSNFDDWLAEVDDWLDSNIGEKVQLMKPLTNNLRHLRQAVILLVEEDKPSRTLKELQLLCPDLSITQLAQICTRFEYERDSSTAGFSPAMIEQMWSMGPTTEDFLLKEDKGLPFTPDEVYQSMDEFEVEDISPPPSLRDPAFYFLQPTAPSQLLLTQGSSSSSSNALALRRLTM